MSNATQTNWSYVQREREGRRSYEIKAGEKTIGHAKTEGNADFICRARREAQRQAMQNASAARQHRVKVDNMRKDIRMLISGLRTVSDALKQTSRERDLTAAREKAHKILKAMTQKGYPALD